MTALPSAPVQVATKAPLSLEVARSMGDLVVVPPTASPQAAYDRALTLIEATRKEIAQVATVKGPTVAPNARDTWLKQNEGVAAVPIVLGALSGVVSLIAGVASDGSATVSMWAGAFAALNLPTFLYMVGAEKRLNTAKAKHKAEEFDTADLERMLASVRQASPAERGMIQPFLEQALRPLDPALSARAAMVRDRLMKDLPAPQGATARAANLALIVDDLRHEGRLSRHLDTLQRLVHDAPPDERQVMAANLEAAAFRGETAIVKGDQNDVRRLYALIEAGLRGEAIASVEA